MIAHFLNNLNLLECRHIFFKLVALTLHNRLYNQFVDNFLFL